MINLVKSRDFCNTASLINVPSADCFKLLHREYLKTLSLPEVRWVTNVLSEDATSFRRLNPSRGSNVGTATFRHASLFRPLAQKFDEVKTM